MASISAVILAAGAGSRLKQQIPKPLVSLMGKPLFLWIVDTLKDLGIQDIVAVIHPSAQDHFLQLASSFDGTYCYQDVPKGTADAARIGINNAQHDKIIILNGDVPCIPIEALEQLIMHLRGLIVFKPVWSGNYGRVVIDNKHAVSIEEQSTEEGYANAGVYVVDKKWALEALSSVAMKGPKKELWITEMVATAYKTSQPFQIIEHGQSWHYEGINTVKQWIYLEEKLQHYYAHMYVDEGVYLDQPESMTLSSTMRIAPGVRIGRGCIFEGDISIASGVVIQPYCVISHSSIGENTRIASFTTISHSQIAADCLIGPYAHIQHTSCHHHVEVGNYVEVKRSALGSYTKAKHLSYLGDVITDEYVNIGAGTITCNYDGIKKHRTYIHTGAFIGAHTTLIAPIDIGAYALVAAGSTIDKDAPEAMLTIARMRPTAITHPLCHTLKERVIKKHSVE